MRILHNVYIINKNENSVQISCIHWQRSSVIGLSSLFAWSKFAFSSVRVAIQPGEGVGEDGCLTTLLASNWISCFLFVGDTCDCEEGSICVYVIICVCFT